MLFTLLNFKVIFCDFFVACLIFIVMVTVVDLCVCGYSDSPKLYMHRLLCPDIIA